MVRLRNRNPSVSFAFRDHGYRVTSIQYLSQDQAEAAISSMNEQMLVSRPWLYP